MKTDGRPTESLCPVCLSTVPATLLAEGEMVWLQGRCPAHGEWRTLVWSGPPSMESWCGDGYTNATVSGGRDAEAAAPAPTSCPGECGLCARHQQHTCTALFEVTRRCNLGCPLCFAESAPGSMEPDPPLAELAEMMRGVFAAQGAVNIQLSGGEPTVRDDLPDIIGAAHAAGFTFVQLNTNGLRLASEAGYAERLREAGLASVFLQFDGLDDDVYRTIRGRPLAALKMRALEACARAGLAVVLVPTVVPGVNDHEIGALVHLATQWPRVVRGVHLQPVSYFGRYPVNGRPRLTLPEVLRLLERETGGEIRAADFGPSCCEHTRCSFRARYWVRDDGRLEPVKSACSCSPSQQDGAAVNGTGAAGAARRGAAAGPATPGSAAHRAVEATSRQWSRRPQPGAGAGTDASLRTQPDGLDRFLDEAEKILCISGMLFQDAWSIDLERVRRCCVHVAVPGRGLVPFCLWNLTSASGELLYARH